MCSAVATVSAIEVLLAPAEEDLRCKSYLVPGGQNAVLKVLAVLVLVLVLVCVESEQ